MNRQTPDLAAPFLRAHGELLAFVESCDESGWHAIPATEQRPVGVLAYHVAAGYAVETELIKAVVAGQPLPAIYLDGAALDQFNAADADEHHDCAREETVALLRRNAAATVAYIRGLSDEDLRRTAQVPILAPHFGARVSVLQLVEGLLPAHVLMHLVEMRAATGGAVIGQGGEPVGRRTVPRSRDATIGMPTPISDPA